MKKYSIITLIMGIIVSLFVLFTRLLGIGWVLIIALIPISNYALFIASQKIKGISKKLMLALIFIVSITINISFLLACTLVVANVPPEKTFDPGIKIDSPDPKGEKAYLELQPMFEKFNAKSEYPYKKMLDYIEKEFPLDENITKILNNTKVDRLNIINVISSTTLYIPKTEIVSTQLNTQKTSQSSMGMQRLFLIELLEIKQLFINGENDKALKKYELLWDSSINLAKSKNISLIYSIHAKGSVQRLVSFYFNNKKFFINDDLKNLNIDFGKLSKDIENCMQKGYMREYQETVESVRNLNYRWPLLDYNQTSKKIYFIFHDIAEETKLSSPKPQDEKLLKEIRSHFDHPSINSVKYYIKNPVGNYFYLNTTHLFSGINRSLFTLKDNLKKMSAEAQ